MISKAEKFYKKDKFKQAEELCLQVLESDQGNVDALRLQSLIMLKTGRVPQGLEFLKLALGQSPENSQNNLAMGLYCIALKKIPEAMNAFLRAYQADPTNTETLLYLGDLHSAQQEWNKALVFYGLYINIDPTNTFVNQTYASHLANCHFKEYSEVQKAAMEHVLKDDKINVRRMLRHWLNMLFNLPSSQELAKAIAEKKYDLKILEPLLDSAFFIKGIEKLRLNSPIIELFLIGIRRELLSSIINNPHFDLAPYSHFLYALSMQSWMNEYSFFIDETEKNLIEKLHNITSEKVNNLDSDHTTIPLVYLYSCYDSPLNITNISQRTKKLKKHSDSNFTNFVTFQIDNSLEEGRIKKTIPSFTEIDDSISTLVREMYEENPYPRGVEPIIIDKKLIDNKPYNILFAGCGTGFQVLAFAQQYPKSQFTGVDLSHSSLAYAIRQTRQRLKLKPTQMRYAQADILKLDQLPDRYDRIFCTGVLHHMEEPEKGLAVLKNILEPHGEMRIALYSETVRKEVVQTRDYIKQKGYPETKEGIRNFRHDVISLLSEKEHPDFIKFLVQIPDFYNLSECRDLVFHIQEHRYTIPQIIDMLDRHDLEFISFNMRHKNILSTFADRFSEPNAVLDPMKWHEYEQMHPHTFVEMYDFNVRHKR
jgi:ubiquinone/menaquinone biosynthesis C-methylase UbiE